MLRESRQDDLQHLFAEAESENFEKSEPGVEEHPKPWEREVPVLLKD